MKRLFQSCLIAAFALIFAGKIMAADVAAEFDAANKLYAEGKFVNAATAYKKTLDSGNISAALYFNYGNAEFKCGHLGRAIAAYRHVLLLSPRDPEARANLEFARGQIQGVTPNGGRWQRWLGALTLNEWTLLAAFALWLTFALLVTRQIWPARKTTLRSPTRAVIICTILICASCGAATAIHFSKQTAVVVAASAPARSGPFDDAQTVFTARDGNEFTVSEIHGDWLQVTDAAGKTGWLERAQVKILPDI
ncbi:MAG TPA: SH3 domain-containing protein [Verrucomicrobiae bacterium]|nr:SH3 domain-containing protein [Verrucomicrobiae bacterium]